MLYHSNGYKCMGFMNELEIIGEAVIIDKDGNTVAEGEMVNGSIKYKGI